MCMCVQNVLDPEKCLKIKCLGPLNIYLLKPSFKSRLTITYYNFE